MKLIGKLGPRPPENQHLNSLKKKVKWSIIKTEGSIFGSKRKRASQLPQFIQGFNLLVIIPFLLEKFIGNSTFTSKY